MRRARLAAALTTLALVVLTPAAAHAAPVTLTAGHVDVFDVDYTGGVLSLDVLDGTGATEVERAPADVVLQVPAAAKITVPSGSSWSFLGASGGTAWVLPQSQNPALLFAGWNTLGVPAAAVQPGSLNLKLTAVAGPGRFSVYTIGAFGTPTKLFDSGDGLPDTRAVAAATHAHANWGFTEAGTYTATFEVTATLASTGTTVTTGAQPFTFTVLN
jgi:surface-anchored protein